MSLPSERSRLAAFLVLVCLAGAGCLPGPVEGPGPAPADAAGVDRTARDAGPRDHVATDSDSAAHAGHDAGGSDLLRTDSAGPDTRVNDAGGGVDHAATDISQTDRQPADSATSDSATSDSATSDSATSDSATSDSAVPDAAQGDSGTPENTPAACSDHVDNDGDPYVDCVDFDCRGIPPCDIPESSTAACTDGHDNDGDHYTDCVDYDCGDVWPCNVPENSPEACVDGYDNDGDEVLDCDEVECAALSWCDPLEHDARTCGDDYDNNGDGPKDCADPGCSAVTICLPYENTDATCSDGVDNDDDGPRDCRDPDCAAVPICNVALLRVVTWNTFELGATDSVAFAAAVDVVKRTDADLFCMQEVQQNEADELATLATLTGYPHVFMGDPHGSMAGDLANACMSRFALVEQDSLSSEDISTDPSAHEISRDIVRLRVEVEPQASYVGAFVVHLKSGTTPADRFRREIEVRRLVQAILAYQLAHPDDGVVAMGDFNEEDDINFESVYETFPDGMPVTFVLGNDISFPVAYDPFDELEAASMIAAQAELEDKPDDFATRIPSGRHIDYIFSNGLLLGDAQVYDACEDNGVDDPPVGNWIDLAGDPLPCDRVLEASDHRPVIADFELP